MSRIRSFDYISRALDRTGVLVCVATATGEILETAGRFGPSLMAPATIDDLFDPDTSGADLLAMVAQVVTGESIVNARVPIGGITCQVCCAAIEEHPLQALLIIVPEYATEAEGASVTFDIGDFLLKEESRMQAGLGRIRELFLWTERQPLVTSASRGVVRRLLDTMCDAITVLQPDGGPVVLTARNRRMDGEARTVEIRANLARSATPSDATLRALDTTFAEFEAATQVPLCLEGSDLVAILPGLTRLRRSATSIREAAADHERKVRSLTG